MGTSTAVERPEPKLGLIRSRLERLQPKLQDVLPKYLTPERMTRLALLAINRQPELLACTAESLAETVMQIGSWGLEIGRTAHIVAFKSRAQAIADYKGKIELAIRGRMIVKCDVRIVREGDVFEVEYGLRERLIHRPDWRNSERPMVGVYAVVTLPGGGTKFDLMNRAEVERIRKRSRSGDKGPWASDFDEMAKKTVVHRLLKLIPQSPQLADAMQAEEAWDRGEPVPEGEFTHRAQPHVRLSSEAEYGGRAKALPGTTGPDGAIVVENTAELAEVEDGDAKEPESA